MEIKLYNTLTRKKETFAPIQKDKVGIYSCGPTVYNYAHIGNLRAYVFADTLKRMFLANGYSVNHVINITDVGHLTGDEDEGEDKLEAGAKREGKSVWDIANFYTKSFFDDLKLLNIIPADNFPKATDNVEEMIKVIKTLEGNGFTYVSGGNVYFDTSKFTDYGKMARISLDPEKMKSRVESDENKKNPFDFVLWFTKYKYKNHEMLWDSPWGKGFPGWHIECTAMATKYLGEHIDIHTGGIDHISVHHTNEIAQSEAAFGHKWVNYWLHNDFLTEKEGQKMAKSKEDFLRLQVLIDKGFDPLDFRYYLLTGHYRSVLQFSFEALEGSRNSLKRAKNKIAEIKKEGNSGSKSGQHEQYLKDFYSAVNDDLNTSVALSVLWKTIDDDKMSDADKVDLIKKYDEVLGLELFEGEKEKIPDNVLELAQKRIEHKKAGDWTESDKIRDKIMSLGYEILDTKDGYEIKKK